MEHLSVLRGEENGEEAGKVGQGWIPAWERKTLNMVLRKIWVLFSIIKILFYIYIFFNSFHGEP